MGCTKSSSEKEGCSEKCLHEDKRYQISSLTLYLKELEKEEQTKGKVSRRMEIAEVRVKVNELETKKTIGQ